MWGRFILLFALSGCSSGVERTAVPGSYEFALDGFRQVLVIGEDGRYTNTLYKDGAAVWSDQEAWVYENEMGGVTLSGFRFGIPEYTSRPRGLWFVVPSKTLSGTKQLCFDDDLGRCFSST